MGNFVLWVKLYWLQAGRFFSLSLHMWNWVYVSVLERDVRNNIICGRRRNYRPSRMCHFPWFPFELSVNSFGAYCVLIFVFFLEMHFTWKTTSLTLYKHLCFHHPPSALLDVYWTSSEFLDTAGMPNIDSVVKAALSNSEHSTGCWS